MRTSSQSLLSKTVVTQASTPTEVMVEMRDGVRLATDIYLPTNTSLPCPVLLERTPYGKRETSHADRTLAHPIPKPRPEVAALFAQAGFVYIIQDCRGRFNSEGVFKKYLNEGPDGFDTVEWIRKQPWCNGAIGTLGLSYGAHVQSAMSALKPPGLKAMFLDSGGFSSAYDSGIRQGGAYELKQLTWAIKHALSARLTAEDPLRKASLEQIDLRHWLRIYPWQNGSSPLSLAPEYESYVAEQWANEVFSEFWRSPALFAAGHYPEMAEVPMVHITGWYDPYALTATQNYRGIADQEKHHPLRLILGPWTHGQRSVSFAGNVDFGPHAPLDGNLAPDYNALRIAWFNHCLRGYPLPEFLRSPVKIFVMGGGSGRRNAEGRLDHGGQWRDEPDWPLPTAQPTAFFFGSDKTLSQQPLSAKGSIDWLHDPSKPVPTVGGAITSGAPIMEGGAYDQVEQSSATLSTVAGRCLADREDVVVFQTDQLSEDTEVTGPISARLWVSSSAVDTDITLKLIDVYPPSADYPQGYAMNLCHGILRLRFRESFESCKAMVPGQIYDVKVQVFPTSNLFVRGHRIRVDLASSNFPHFDINPNTGAPAGERSTPVIARNTIHCGPQTPSHILLPIVPRSKP